MVKRTDVGTRIWNTRRNVVLTITATKQVAYLISALDNHVCLRHGSSITTTIDGLNTCESTTLNNNFGLRARSTIRWRHRIIRSQITSAINIRDIIRVETRFRLSADVGFTSRLCCIDMHHHIALRRSVDVVTTEYLSNSATSCIPSDGCTCFA